MRRALSAGTGTIAHGAGLGSDVWWGGYVVGAPDGLAGLAALDWRSGLEEL
ncbi:MAG: hypothetical protein JWP70_1130, partial [Leifsonia sp.]|nr:hypothetical protein [Leifsonia sp.]